MNDLRGSDAFGGLARSGKGAALRSINAARVARGLPAPACKSPERLFEDIGRVVLCGPDELWDTRSARVKLWLKCRRQKEIMRRDAKAGHWAYDTASHLALALLTKQLRRHHLDEVRHAQA